jgi:UDP-3-O-[3-hydroxymyristoyl] glucosamine N-acyltransferase
VSGEGTQQDNGGEGVRVLTAAAIAEAVGGQLRGDGSAHVTGIAPLDRARGEHLSFLASAKYAAQFAASRAGVVLVSPELAETPSEVRARVIVARPHDALLSLIPRFYSPPRRTPGIHPTAIIGTGVTLGADVSIGAYVVIEAGAVIGDRASIGSHCAVGAGVRLGADVALYPGVTLYAGAELGDRVIVHSGARIASDGFGYVFREGKHEKIPHVGRCVIEHDVEIGANSTLDRGSIDDTVVGAGTKIDNLVHIAHNVRIGRLCLIMAQVGIAGSVRVEDGCILAGQVGISGHHTIGKGATLAAQAGVFGDIPAGETWSGYPARPHKEALRAQAALFKLSGLIRGIERLLEREQPKTAERKERGEGEKRA